MFLEVPVAQEHGWKVTNKIIADGCISYLGEASVVERVNNKREKKVTGEIGVVK